MDSSSSGADLETFMVGIYANAVPCLCTYVGEVTPTVHVAQIATTLRFDKSTFRAPPLPPSICSLFLGFIAMCDCVVLGSAGRGYDGTYNYFDPDNFFTLSTILYSGDAYLQDQVSQVSSSAI